MYAREVLWDSGATNALEPGHSLTEFDDDERYSGRVVNVSLAAGKRHRAYLLHDALYTNDVSQAICPAGRVIQKLGLELEWNAHGCYLLYPCEINRTPAKVVIQKLRIVGNLPHITWPIFDKIMVAMRDPAVLCPEVWQVGGSKVVR